MDAIFTKYHGPRGLRGSRISAKCGDQKVVIEVDDRFSVEKNHEHAMVKLAFKMNREGFYVGGEGPGGARVWLRTIVHKRVPAGDLTELLVHEVEKVKVMR